MWRSLNTLELIEEVKKNLYLVVVDMDIIKVAIADDHQIFRKGVILSLRHYSNLKFVLEAENGQQLLEGFGSFIVLFVSHQCLAGSQR